MIGLIYGVVCAINVVQYYAIAERYGIIFPAKLLMATYAQAKEKDSFWVIFHTLSFVACVSSFAYQLWKI